MRWQHVSPIIYGKHFRFLERGSDKTQVDSRRTSTMAVKQTDETERTRGVTGRSYSTSTETGREVHPEVLF